MKRKTWVMVKRGLITDPKHREAIGQSVWLYLYILDRCDWEHGAVIEWRDKDEAENLDMPLATLRWQRKRLEEAGYLTSERHGNKQRLAVQKWVNPREYTGKVYNGVATDCDTEDARVTTRVTTVREGNEGTLKGTRSHITLKQEGHKPALDTRLFAAIAKTCQTDPKTTGASLGKVAKVLTKAGYVEADIQAFDKWWWGDKKMRQRPPTIWQLQEQIGVVRAKKEEEKPKDQFIPPSMLA